MKTRDMDFPNLFDESSRTKRELDQWQNKLDNLPEVTFAKISYDKILGDLTAEYGEQHPETPFHEIIDIIRPKADDAYLDHIARHCNSAPQIPASSEQVNKEKDEGNCVATSAQPLANLPKTIIYLDRNNTPDVWGDIKKTV